MQWYSLHFSPKHLMYILYVRVDESMSLTASMLLLILCMYIVQTAVHYCRQFLYQRVDRVLGFFSSRPNWEPLPPHPQASVSPPLWFRGGGGTLACGRGGGEVQFGRGDRHCGIRGIYVLCGFIHSLYLSCAFLKSLPKTWPILYMYCTVHPKNTTLQKVAHFFTLILLCA